jgi:hypothetical protein
MTHQGPMFNTTRLEHPYGVGLVDDLHNFFPEMLYDTALFASPLVGFLQRRVQTLFEADYTRNRTQYRMFQQVRRRREAGIPMPATLLTPAVPPPPIPTVQINPWTITQTTGNVEDVLAEVQTLFTTLGVQGINGLFQQVGQEQPAIPTTAQIQEATLLTTLEPPADVECSICQDHTPPNNEVEWRILRHCNHRFHRSCIDTWFERNAHCPVCRHDIRDQTTG